MQAVVAGGIVTEEGGARTYYAADGGQVLAEYTEYGTGSVPQWTKSYVYLGARLLSTHTAGSYGEAVQYHHPDRLGTRLVTNASDTNSFEQATLPYGTALGAESSGATNRRFTSYDRSNVTGLDYAVNRHYDAQQGRFTQVDPIEMDAVSLDDPQTLNLYAYCANDPVNNLDPDGLFFGFIKKLFKGIWKVLTNKWFLLAVTVALTVIAIGANFGLFALTKTVQVPLGFDLGYGAAAATAAATKLTALGLLNLGLQVAAGVSAIGNLQGIYQNAIGFGIGSLTSGIGGGAVGAGGTPDWNPEANEFQARPNARRWWPPGGRSGHQRRPSPFGYYRPRHWRTRVPFRGNMVYQRDDINPNLRGKDGRTNLQRMQDGNPPLGHDGREIILHHMLQTQGGPIAELTTTQHRQWSRTIHINPNTIPSGINRSRFNSWREHYWRARAQDFIYGPVRPWGSR